VLVIAAITASTLRFVSDACASTAVPAGSSGPSAPPVPAATPSRAQAMYDDPGGAEGSCSLGLPSADGLYVSLPLAEYAGGAPCGTYLDITGPLGSVRAEVTDSCPRCTARQISLSRAAFARIDDLARGLATVTYQTARDPRLPGPLELRMAAGSTRDRLAIQVINHGNPLASVEIAARASPGGASPGGASPGGADLRWQALTLTPDSYWVAAGAGPGPFAVRITDASGHQVVATGITLSPGSLQQTSAQMYGGASPEPPRGTAAAASPAPASARVPRSSPAAPRC